MDQMLSRLGGIGLGATLMYFLDPQGGRRRRALVRDQIVHLSHELVEFADVTGRDAANRIRGLWAEARSATLGKTPAPTQLIVGGDDEPVIELNEWALARLGSPVKKLQIVPGASHLFEEPGTLENVAELAADWFTRYLVPADESEAG
jgi:pimeloyl-ACP methyl ester carboxylesterase